MLLEYEYYIKCVSEKMFEYILIIRILISTYIIIIIIIEIHL